MRQKLFVLGCCGAAFGFLLNLMTLVLRYQKRSTSFMVITLFGVALNFGITYVLLSVFSYGILAPLFGTLFSSTLCFILLFATNLSGLTIRLKSSHIKKIIIFGLQASASGFLFYLLDYVDRLILKDLSSMSDVGVYSLGAKIGALINITLLLPFSLIWSPMRMEYLNEENNKEFSGQILLFF